MQKKYTLGAVLGIVAASFSFLFLVYTVIVWIMSSTGDYNDFAEVYYKALLVVLQDGIHSMTETTSHLLFAGLTVFFSMGIWVNIHSAFRLSGRGAGTSALSVVFGVLSCIGSVVWLVVLTMCFVLIGRSEGYLRGEMLATDIILIIISVLADFCLETVAVSLFRQARDYNQSSYGDPSNTFFRQMNNNIPQPTPQPFVNPNPQPAPQPFADPNPQPAPQPFVDPNPQPAPQPIVDPNPQPAPQPFIEPAPKMGRVRVTEGVSLGQGYKLQPGYKIIVGKNAQSANLVINNPHVSNVHCSIRYNPVMDTYIVKDYSSNGTYVYNQRLPKETPVEYPAGTVLSLADGTSKITLG